MAIRIVSAEERMAAPRTAKIVIFGPSGVGKTSLLHRITVPTLLVDMEAGDLSVAEWGGDSIRIRRWEDARDLACLIGGPNAALPANEPFSEAHYAHVVATLGERDEVVGKYGLVFWDSITVLSRLAMIWAEVQPENIAKNGSKDTRGAYGLMGREMLKLLTHLQHCPDKHVVMVGILEQKLDDFNRTYWEPQMEGSKVGRELPGIVDEVFTMAWHTDTEGNKHRVFFTEQGNDKGYPAKDRSGRLLPIEPADLQAVLDKINAKNGAKA